MYTLIEYITTKGELGIPRGLDTNFCSLIFVGIGVKKSSWIRFAQSSGWDVKFFKAFSYCWDLMGQVVANTRCWSIGKVQKLDLEHKVWREKEARRLHVQPSHSKIDSCYRSRVYSTCEWYRRVVIANSNFRFYSIEMNQLFAQSKITLCTIVTFWTTKCSTSP